MDMFTYMYKATIYDEIANDEVARAGILVAEDMEQAFRILYGYYREELVTISIEDIGSYAQPIKIDPKYYDVVKEHIKEKNCL